MEPAGQTLQAAPALKVAPPQPGSVLTATATDDSATADSLREQRDSSRRDFSRQMKYVSQGERP